MGKQKKPKIPVTDYTMSVHVGVALGPVDAITKIWTGEKVAWTGRAESQQDILIRNLDLYGGPKKEGGVEGIAHFMPGGPAQLVPDVIAAKFGLTSATMPAFRGVSTIFFHGNTSEDPNDSNSLFIDNNIDSWALFGRFRFPIASGGSPNGVKGKPGFYWQSQNPTLKAIWVTAEDCPRALGTLYSRILNPDTVSVEDSNSEPLGEQYDANPAHMIYECLTDTDFGMGASSEQINTASFLLAAETLYNEDFGMSMMWTQQSTIENYVGEILDHIQAVLFVNPKDGLITLKLLRDDYVAEEAPLFTPANCVVQKFGRKGEGEIINEIVVTYTNPVNEDDVTTSIQNLAGIVAAGGIVSDGRNYYGVRRIDLAAKLANRDIRSASIPLARCEMVTSRDGWDLTPGAVLRLTYPEHGLEEVVFRVGAINYGKSKDTSIRVTLTEDIFGYDPGDYVVPNGTAWVDTSQQPEPLLFEQITTLPYYMQNQIDTVEEGNAMAAFLGASTQTDAYGFDLLVETAMSDGSLSYELAGLKTISGRAVLDTALDQEATTLTDLPSGSVNADALPGVFLFVGDGTESDQEIIYIRTDTSNSGGVYILDRGMLDTTPKAWPVGTPVWFIDPTTVFYDNAEFAQGSIINTKFLTRTSLGRLDEDDADIVSHMISERPALPLRPANVRVLGEQWDDPVDPASTVDLSNSAAEFVSVTWANRNKDTEDSTLLRWTDGNVTPPDGVFARVTVLALDRTTVWFTHDTAVGDVSYDIDPAEFDGPVGVVRVTSVDGDGNESLQGHEITARVRLGGFGFDFGENFGGA